MGQSSYVVWFEVDEGFDYVVVEASDMRHALERCGYDTSIVCVYREGYAEVIHG